MSQYLPLRQAWLRGLMLVMLNVAGLAHAAGGQEVQNALRTCQTEFAEDASRRLVCFDKVAEQYTPTHLVPPILAPSQQELVSSVGAETHYLARKWHLNGQEELHFTDLETHQLNYLMTTYSSNPNDIPSSPSRLNSQDRDLGHNDLHFQISLKTQLLEMSDWLPKNQWIQSARLWGAYSQQSFWQVYNAGQSRPMRDHNYSPELILSLGLNKSADEQRWRTVMPDMLNVGLVHESNGRSQPLSRSWNRFYLQGGWQLNERYSLLVRPWWRIPESKSEDDNPDISKYLGYGDVMLRWENEANTAAASMTLRNNMRSDNKGYVS